MKKLPKFTIICPAFNQAAFIESTIDSVLSQKFENLEFIIIDGGSTDGTAGIIKKHEKFLTYWESTPDKGQSHAINKGLQRATGDIENWLNSDDELAPGALELMADYACSNPDCDVFVGQRLVIDPEDKPLYYNYCRPYNLHKDMLAFLLYPPQEATFWRASLRKRVGYVREDLHYSMDFDWYLRLSSVGKCCVIPKVIGHYRMYPEQKSWNRDETDEDLFRIRREFLKSKGRSLLLNKVWTRVYRLKHKLLGRIDPHGWEDSSKGFNF